MGLLKSFFGPKKRYRQFKARAQRLPGSYHTAFEALEHYSYYFGFGTAEGGLSMLEDLLDLFEQSAANGTPIRKVVGEDPVEFADAFLRNYPQSQWMYKARKRLISAVERAEGIKTA